LAVIISLVLLGLGSLQGSQTFPFDAKKCQRELEVMKGILQTTVDFVAKELSGVDGGTKKSRFEFGPIIWNSERITAFYLAGQGAVFTIPASAVRSPHRYADRVKMAFGTEVYYRLKQIDINGNSHYSDSIMIKNGSPDKMTDLSAFSRIYPNPFKTETMIEYYLTEPSLITIKVFDNQGRLLRILDKGKMKTIADKLKEI
jgi:hypothetical protein